MEIEDSSGGKDEDVPEISLHAIVGTRATKTMRVYGNLHYSTHNFVSETLSMSLKPISSGRLEVIVASGERLTSPR
ncbi:hypothetical protein AMTRI_Chr11g97230 [Amborella trichopoda]